MPLPRISTSIINGVCFLLSTQVALSQSGCDDPPAPNSFVIHRDLEFTLSDGYRTYADVRIPDAAPGSCGWPVIVVVHGAGFGKEQLAWDAVRDSKQGFATICYDVRGQGSSMALNDPAIYGRGPLGLRDRMDLFEVLEQVGATFPNEIDLSRAGVTGKSQGSYLTWAAAAHSGKLPPPNPWRTAPFPVIAAIVPRNNPPTLNDASFPQAAAVSEKHMKSLYDPQSGVHHDPIFFAQVDALIRAEDYATLNGIPAGQGEDMIELLKTSTVPTRITLAYDDVHFPINCTTDWWDSILPNTPKLLNITTGGHSTPSNDQEERIRRVRRQQWFHHFLRGVDNGVTNNSQIRMSIRPESRIEYNDEESLWDFREFESWPPPTTPYKLWLDSAGVLSESKGSSGKEFIYNHWNLPYTIDDYISELPLATEVQNYLPVDFADWLTPSFTEDRIMMGEGMASLWVATTAQDFQVHVALFDVDPTGFTSYICGGTSTIRDNQISTAQSIAVPINVYGYPLRKGHKLKMRVENLAWNRPPGGGEVSTLRAVPVFTDFDLKIKYGADNASLLRLPILPVTGPTLACTEARIPVNRLWQIDFAVHSDSTYAGEIYSILPSVSGTSPGSLFNGIQIALNQDGFTRSVLNDNGLFGLQSMTGTLDATGRAEASIQFPAPVQAWFYPEELDFLVVVSDGSQFLASKPVVLKRIHGD